MKKKGFTLVELAVVMAIIAILVLLIVGAIIAARNAQIRTVHRANAQTTRTALESYYVRNQSYPTFSSQGANSAFAGSLSGFGSINTSGTSCTNGGVLVSASGSAYSIHPMDIDSAPNCTTTMGSAITYP